MSRVPSHAFDEYVSAGDGRSYQAMATRYGVSKRAIGKRASRERWQERLAKIEDDARRKLDEKLTEDMQAVNFRHLRTLRAIQGKALQALQALPLNSGMDAVRALDLAIRGERGILRPRDALGSDIAPVILQVVTGVPASPETETSRHYLESLRDAESRDVQQRAAERLRITQESEGRS